MRGGIDTGGECFRPRLVVVDVLKDFTSGDRTLSSPGSAGPRLFLKEKSFTGARSQPTMTDQHVRGVAVFTPCGTTSSRGVHICFSQ